jgi:hypothetical protein
MPCDHLGTAVPGPLLAHLVAAVEATCDNTISRPEQP